MFREDKATQIAAQFLQLADGSMKYLNLIKLLYLSDKQMLLRWGEPMIYDQWYSMRYGPVVSKTYELIKAGIAPGDYWSDHICTKGNFAIFQSDPGNADLSSAENAIITEVYEEYGNMDQWDLVRLSHTFPEWSAPGRSSRPISYEDVLLSSGFSPSIIQDIIENIESQNVGNAC